ncbi:uncharacterized protein A4U43_C03F22430 [Asparagus officinalis]|uniref:ABC transporter domain-containing protein n=1 Tax=Asparagus officinalis TaxID=4686 RepID=A0A5P1FC41_ASPOF|nr:ABC transporter G family member 9 [Asparagus officinalis]ONK75966.1 uncharacterized protein A4U43_C03F22430 [Asparagus officinalis]
MEESFSVSATPPAPDQGGRHRSIFAKSKHPVILKFEDVVYKINTETSNYKCVTEIRKKLKSKKGGSSSNSDSEREILKGLSGAVVPGEMLAMMGPSGSGKTTLLTALGGRMSGGGHVSGSITYNGRPLSNGMRRNMGFVTQDDVLYPHLTVTETLVYTALLRLPKSLSKQEKVSQAEAVMGELGLNTCRNSIIGGPMLRGVSGGERKRVSIGQEMLINPSLLFLDEPTSGLDSTTAQRIVSTLWELSKGGRTVVMTIHQPSSRLFYMFHKLLLLSDGNPVYFGKGSEALDYFARIGYVPAVPMNPADFLLDLANGVLSDDTLDNRIAIKEALVTAYKSHVQNRVRDEGREVTSHFKQEEPETNQWTTSWWEQFKVLLERGIKERRHESFSGLKIAQVLVVAVVSGILWWQSGAHVQDQVGLLFFISGFWGFFPVFQAIFTFPQERMMLTKERSSRMYRLSSYFMSRVVGDLPMELILPTGFITIVYWMSGLKPTAANYFTTLSVLLLSVLVAQGIGLAIGALIMNLKSAATLGSVIMLTFMLAGGYYVQNVPVFISWIRYVSMSFYSFKLLVASQYSATDTYGCNPMATCKVADIRSVDLVGFSHRSAAIMAMFAMLFAYRFIAYLALMRIGVTR